MNNLLRKKLLGSSCILKRQIVARPSVYFCQSAQHKGDTESEWRAIYKLPTARLASAFNRLKLYQAGLTAFGIPAAEMLVSMLEAPPQTTYIVATIGVTGLTTLTLGSLLLKNLVGLIYLNKNEDQLKLAYIDFWGHRQHKVIAIDDLVPEWEISKSRFAFYQPIKSRQNEKETFKLVHRLGVVTEKMAFSSLFGD